MTVRELIAKKRELGYSCEKIAELSGVPLGTVQKVFSGITANPRLATREALSKVFEDQAKSSVVFEDGERVIRLTIRINGPDVKVEVE